jgi:outer membrane protein assembly factor BamB
LELLTWADGRIVFNTNSGVVMALDAATGQRLWAFRYPRASRSTGQDISDQPVPAIYDDGRVYVAPVDSDGIFAMDAHDGRLLWQLRGLEGVLLHAVTARHLFATVRRPLPAVLAINVQTGSPRRSEGGWFVPLRDVAAESALSLATLHHLLYPTRAGMLALRHEDGTPTFDPLSDQLPLANYLMVDGMLIGVTPQYLLGCRSERLRFSPPP